MVKNAGFLGWHFIIIGAVANKHRGGPVLKKHMNSMIYIFNR